jgi:hypothetical protein
MYDEISKHKKHLQYEKSKYRNSQSKQGKEKWEKNCRNYSSHVEVYDSKLARTLFHFF